ncbi:hypothetical protein MMF93_32435 [Streptomyces tubbatahanensis]|uniref:Serine/threonine protein kinase n=1 Tax=Streptomyces tubbatahanensis TaxID=2923272 RepID=A0ABY3Y1F3_9ACTN|nr:hypothetical protein [Streptomyces tubbatahanensis]UNT00665.1 hypothetical protein MMF93_32435 [Streptomyces tubbatahanensis]
MTVCAVTALLCTSAGAQASPGAVQTPPGSAQASPGSTRAEGDGGHASRSGGWHGPVVSHPGQPEIDYPRGEVCAFPTHAEFPVVDMVQKTWTNDAGDPVYAVISGPLIMDVTNKDTGKTVRRDLSGTGTLSYPDPGRSDTYVLSGGDWGVGLHTSDRPAHNKWLVSRGFMSVRLTKSGGETHRELLTLEGRYENLCETLKP